MNSEIGRTEYLLVGLVAGSGTPPTSLAAYPMGSGSGSVTTFSRADGFVTIDRHREMIDEGQRVVVRLLGRDISVADLVIIGSHCVGVDCLIGHVQQKGWHCKFLAVGSTAGLAAAKRGECDIAGIHLLEPISQRYNTPFLSPGLILEPGYHRRQGIVYRRGDVRFEQQSSKSAIANATEDPDCIMINRNPGSGTRILIDQLLGGSRPDGYASQPRSHNAVASAVAQHRADWGLAIERVADHLDLGFIPIADETFDFVIPSSRHDHPPVKAWLRSLQDPDIQWNDRARSNAVWARQWQRRQQRLNDSHPTAIAHGATSVPPTRARTPTLRDVGLSLQ